MVSKVSQLLGKGKMVSFETENGQVDFLIKPLKNKELLEIMDLAVKNDSKKMMVRLLYFTLAKDDTELKEEEIENMDAPYLLDLLNTISEVNHLDNVINFQQGGQALQNMTSKPASKEELLARLRVTQQVQNSS